MSAQADKRIDVLGSQYSCMRFDDVVQTIIAKALEHESGYVCVANVHTTMMGYFDDNYRSITNRSLLSVPDGMPIRWAMNLLGADAQDRVRGPALMRAICDRGREQGVRHFLYGATDQTLRRLETYLKEQYPGIEIVGKISPPFRALRPEELEKDLDFIRNTDAHIVWVGLGAPKQEQWMSINASRISGVSLGVGAAFDLLPGVIREAPSWMQAIGMEWLYRLLMEPRRLWRRYIFNNPAFVLLFVAQFVRERVFRVSNPAL